MKIGIYKIYVQYLSGLRWVNWDFSLTQQVCNSTLEVLNFFFYLFLESKPHTYCICTPILGSYLNEYLNEYKSSR